MDSVMLDNKLRSYYLLLFTVTLCLDLEFPRLWGVILNNLALNSQRPLNHLFAWSCTIGESDLMLCNALTLTSVHR